MSDPLDPSVSGLFRRSTARGRRFRGLFFGTAAVLIAAGLPACSSTANQPVAPKGSATAGTLSRSSPAPLPDAEGDPLHRTLDVILESDGNGGLLGRGISDGAPFTEVLPSWNAATDVPFEVDVRARAKGDWSPWLRIGDWGVSGRGEVATAFEGGKVAVDVLKLQEPCLDVELRFRPAEGVSPGLGAPLEASSLRASVVLSHMGDLDQRLGYVAGEPYPMPVQLTVAARSQRDVGDDIGGRVCSPTSVSMVCAFHGTDVETRAMANALLDPHHDIYGNWNRAVQGPAAMGVPGRLVRVSSWDTVHAYLDRGLPVVASIKAKEGELRGAPYEKTAGHLLVVTGLGPGGKVYVNDPAAKYALDVPRSYRRADMEKVWFANGGVAYVFGPGAQRASVRGSDLSPSLGNTEGTPTR